MKKLSLLALIAALTLSTVACGSTEEETDTETTETALTEETEDDEDKMTSMDIEYDVDDYVTLGDYENLKVTISGDYSMENALNSMLSSDYVEDDTQTVVQEDSIVNVDYVGSQDGVAFDGGSATNQMLDVANNSEAGGSTSYIDGFTAGLPGAEVGSEVAYEVTFPDNYGATDLAGQTVTFTFTINYIAKAITAADLTDEYVAENYTSQGYTTVEELQAAAQELADSNKETDTRSAVIDEMENICEVTIPEDVLAMRVDEYIDRYTESYVNSDTTLEDYLSDYSMSVDDFTDQVQSMLEASLVDELIFEAVAKKEGIEIDDAEFTEYVETLASTYGYSSVDDIYSAYGPTVKSGEFYMRKMYLANLACDFIVDQAVVSVM